MSSTKPSRILPKLIHARMNVIIRRLSTPSDREKSRRTYNAENSEPQSLTRLSPATLSLLKKNKEALAIHNDPYGLQPIKFAGEDRFEHVFKQRSGRMSLVIL